MVDERTGVVLTLTAVVGAIMLDLGGALPGLTLVVGLLAALALLAIGVLILGEIRDGVLLQGQREEEEEEE